MAALPYMQLYVADYLADTAHLTTEEHGAYLLLLFSYWQTGKPLRADRLASVARMSNERWTDVERTLEEFFHVGNGVWTHFRVEADLEGVTSKTKKASDAGKASARARAYVKQALKDAIAENVPTDVATDVEQTYQRNANHTRSGDTDTDTDLKQDQDQDQKLLSSKPDDQGGKLKKRKVDETPYQDILDAYQRICSGKFLGAEVLNDKRKRSIKRTYELSVRGGSPFQDRGIEFWDKYFSRCVTNQHWCGVNDRGWKADLEFVLREENVFKVLGV